MTTHNLNIYDNIVFETEDKLEHSLSFKHWLDSRPSKTISWEQRIKQTLAYKPRVYKTYLTDGTYRYPNLEDSLIFKHTIGVEINSSGVFSKVEQTVVLTRPIGLLPKRVLYYEPHNYDPAVGDPVDTFAERAGTITYTKFPNSQVLSAYMKWLKDLATFHGFTLPDFKTYNNQLVSSNLTPTGNQTDISNKIWNIKNYFNYIHEYIIANIPEWPLFFEYSGVWITSGIFPFPLIPTNYPTGTGALPLSDPYAEDIEYAMYWPRDKLDPGRHTKYEQESYWNLFPNKLVKCSGPPGYGFGIRKTRTLESEIVANKNHLTFAVSSASNFFSSATSYLRVSANNGGDPFTVDVLGQDISDSNIQNAINQALSDAGSSESATVVEEYSTTLTGSDIKIFLITFSSGINYLDGTSTPLVRFTSFDDVSGNDVVGQTLVSSLISYNDTLSANEVITSNNFGYITKNIKWSFYGRHETASRPGITGIVPEDTASKVILTEESSYLIYPLNDMSFKTRFGIDCQQLIGKMKTVKNRKYNGYKKASQGDISGNPYYNNTGTDLATKIRIKYCLIDGPLPRLNAPNPLGLYSEIEAATKITLCEIDINDSNPDIDTVYDEYDVFFNYNPFIVTGKYIVFIFEADNFPTNTTIPDSDWHWAYDTYFSDPYNYINLISDTPLLQYERYYNQGNTFLLSNYSTNSSPYKPKNFLIGRKSDTDTNISSYGGILDMKMEHYIYGTKPINYWPPGVQ